MIGAGSVAFKKIEGLMKAGANICVVAKQASSPIRVLAVQEKLTLELRAYHKEDLRDVFLVFAATNDSECNRQIYQDTREMKILLNAVDQPEECDFTIPARVEKGDLLLTISTGGRGPFFSKILRKYFEKKFSDEFEQALNKIFEVRQKMIQLGRAKEFALYMDEKGENVCGELMGSKPFHCVEKIIGDLGLDDKHA